MRSMLGIMAACLLGFSSPAAAVVVLGISGTMEGTKTTIVCGPGSARDCLAVHGGATATQPFGEAFVQSLTLGSLVQGDNPFSFGFARGGGMWSGIIQNDNGVLTGRALTYFHEDSNVRFGTVGAAYISASAGTFNVTGAIPEPGTWALMLLGFMAIGTALRSAPRRALTPA